MTWSCQGELEAHWSLIVPHRRGFAPSPAAANQDFHTDAADLADLITEIPGGVHLVAFSYGGLGASIVAGQLPQRIRSLTLVEVPLWTAAENDESVDELIALADRFAASPDDTEAEHEFFTLAGVDPNKPAAQDIRQAIDMARAHRSPREAHPRFDAITEARIPALVISGGHNPGMERLCDAIATRLDAQRACLRGAGHAVPRATGFNTLLEAFLTAAERRHGK